MEVAADFSLDPCFAIFLKSQYRSNFGEAFQGREDLWMAGTLAYTRRYATTSRW